MTEHCRRCDTALSLRALFMCDGRFVREVECPGCGHAGRLRKGQGFGAVFQRAGGAVSELPAHDGERVVADGGDDERLPWCEDCNCFAVPDDDGTCGECNADVVLTDGGGNVDHVMVDIETLGLEPGAAILSIGAVRFGPGQLGETFYQEISLESCQEAGLHIDAGTLEWWLSQEQAARDVLTGGDPLGKVLPAFRQWHDGADEVWANSPSFDCEHLEHAFDAVGMAEPWTFYEERDYRTLASLSVTPDLQHDGDEHNALDDAKHQAHVAAATLKRLRDGDWRPEDGDAE